MSDVVAAVKEILLADEFLKREFECSLTGRNWVMRHAPTTKQVARKLGVSMSKASYHLNKAAKNGEMNKHKWKEQTCCWFPIGWDYKD